MVTISDIKIGKDAPGGAEIDYYEADVVTAQDYYPGGMLMPGREYSNGNDYRFSINGQEKTPEIAPNTTTAEYWQYDARIVRRWNVDPRPSVGLSPYATFGNNPIWRSDPLGDTARVDPTTGQLGQQFKFTKGEGISDEQFKQMQDNFYANLDQQINQGGHQYNGKPVSLNTNDPLASIINVTFGATGTSNASMENNSIYISLEDMLTANNTATHEWLHTAGLMDRYIEVWGYDANRKGDITLNSQRSGAIAMKNLPTGYDNDYSSTQNMMSVSGGQITQQQWSIVFAGISERSQGGLGVVSVLLPNKGSYSIESGYTNKVSNALGSMAFSSRQAFVLKNSGGTILQKPFPTGYGKPYTYWILHNQGGNTYPGYGSLPNTNALNDFKR